jgi:uncharacterized protein
MKAPSTKSDSNSSLAEEIVLCILKVKRPVAVVLFGSEARESAGSHSDLDILIIEHENGLPRHQRAVDYRAALMDLSRLTGRDIDLLVYTKQEIDEWTNVPNAFVTTALREGKVLYENFGRPGQRLVSQG